MGLTDFLFPKKCLGCGIFGLYICEKCIEKVRPGGWANINGLKVYSVWRYEGVVRKAIIALKYKFATEIADELINHLVTLLVRQKHHNLVSIPSFWYKENLRGFNQAELLGQKLATKMGWGFLPGLLIKTRHTPPQVGLKGTPRRQNLHGAFSVSPHYSSFDVRSSIMLFDDVLTTGSTLKEAASALKSIGVKKLWGLAIAR